MAKKNWQALLEKGMDAKFKAESYLDNSVRALMASKGFSEEQLLLFSACFAGGNETVIHFNRECAMADLDISIAKGMTKDEIISCLSRYASEETIKLLKGE